MVSFVWPDQSPLAEQDSQHAPQEAKKKRKKAKKVGQIKVADARLEGIVDWVDPILSEPVEEREEDMSSLDAGFTTRMRKRAASDQRETTSGSKGLGSKRLKWSSLDEEA